MTGPVAGPVAARAPAPPRRAAGAAAGSGCRRGARGDGTQVASPTRAPATRSARTRRRTRCRRPRPGCREHTWSTTLSCCCGQRVGHGRRVRTSWTKQKTNPPGERSTTRPCSDRCTTARSQSLGAGGGGGRRRDVQVEVEATAARVRRAGPLDLQERVADRWEQRRELRGVPARWRHGIPRHRRPEVDARLVDVGREVEEGRDPADRRHGPRLGEADWEHADSDPSRSAHPSRVAAGRPAGPHARLGGARRAVAARPVPPGLPGVCRVAASPHRARLAGRPAHRRPGRRHAGRVARGPRRDRTARARRRR